MSTGNAVPPGDSGRMRTFLRYVCQVWTIVEMEGRKLRKDPTEMMLRGIQPALWLLIFGQAFSRIRGIPTGGSTYMEFLTPGILSQSVTFLSIFYGIMIIWDRDMGLLQKIMSTPIYRSAFILGKMLSASIRATTQCIIILILAVILGVQIDWGLLNIAGVFLCVIVGASFFSGLSMVFATLVRTRERMMGIGQMITMPLFFASNALYPIEIMPGWLQVVATINPLSYLVDSLRGLLLITHDTDLLFNLGVLMLAGLIVCLLATRLLPRISS